MSIIIMKKSISIPRGTTDILPEDTSRWISLEQSARRLLGCYGYNEIRTPVFEETELFARSVGQTSDIVQKQMLNLAPQGMSSDAQDIGPTVLSLRPEGTAPVVRSYIQNRFDRKERLSKLFYIGPMFRGERPQKGRLRQFHQIGVEAIGPESGSPYLDAEVISLCVALVDVFGVKDFDLKLNTLGTSRDKEHFGEHLRQEFQSCISDLCPDCQDRYKRNVFRVLDCKNTTCRKVVQSLSLDYQYLSDESRAYFESVKAILDSQGIRYIQDPRLVRGLDYYTHTVFELSCPNLGSQDAVGAGGRYNDLVEQLGGPKADATGFALGIERLLLVSGKSGGDLPGTDSLDVFMIGLGEDAVGRAFHLVQALRARGVSADMRFSADSLKSQMRQADKSYAAFVLMIGEDELAKGTVVVKDMKSGAQEEMSLEDMEGLVGKLKMK